MMGIIQWWQVVSMSPQVAIACFDMDTCMERVEERRDETLDCCDHAVRGQTVEAGVISPPN